MIEYKYTHGLTESSRHETQPIRHGTSGPCQSHVRYVQAPSLCRLSQAERGLTPSGRGATVGADIAVTAISVPAVTLYTHNHVWVRTEHVFNRIQIHTRIKRGVFNPIYVWVKINRTTTYTQTCVG